MAEEHGNIDRIEHYYVIKAWQDKDGNKHYLFDHDTCAVKFIDGAVWNNKIGQWGVVENNNLDQEFCDEIWEKLNMDNALANVLLSNTEKDK